MLIESAQNETYKTLLSLTSSKGLKETGQFLLCGEKLIREFLSHPTLEIVGEVGLSAMVPVAPDARQIVLAAPLFETIDVLGTHRSILVLKQPEMPVLTASDLATYEPQGIELVAPIGDPGNLGAMIRSAEAFGVPRVILAQQAAHPFLPKSVKASAGSVMRVPMARGPSLADFPDTCIALDLEGESINNYAWPSCGLLLIGEEGPGYSTSRFPNRVRIPTTGVESLNVVVAASIALSRLPPR